MKNNGISFKQFNRIAPIVIRSRKPIMGHGPHGIGKSALAYQLADKLADILGDDFKAEWGDDYVFPVVERRASQMADTGDVIGVPEPEDSSWGRKTTFAPMGWFLQACNEPCILFVDELDRGNSDVRQAFMELTDSRKIAGHTLHPDTIIIGMVNGGSHDEQNAYQVAEMDPAESDRWWHCNLQPTVEDWLDWADGNVTPIVREFIRDNAKHLEHDGAIEPHKVYPSRRSWHHFDRALRQSADAGFDLLSAGEDGRLSSDLILVGEGFVGNEAAIKFHDYVETYAKQVSVDDVLSGRRRDIIEAWTVNEADAMLEKLAESDRVKEGANLTDDEVAAIGWFVYTIPCELAMKAWGKLTKANDPLTTRLWSKVVGDDKTFGRYIAEVCGNLTEDN